MHAWNNVWLEWGIRRLKQKWKRLIKCFDFAKQKCSHLFLATIIMINFLHKYCIDFTYEINNDQIEDPIDYG